MLTTTPGYLASRDTLTFHKRQSPSEQQMLLGNKSLPQLYSLRGAIEHRGEKIPGRTGEESLAMVNHVIAWCHGVDRDRRREETRRSLWMLLYLVAAAAAVAVTLCFPALLEALLAQHI